MRGQSLRPGIDGVGLLVNVLIPYPGTAYEKPNLWLARVREGVIDDTTIATFFRVS